MTRGRAEDLWRQFGGDREDGHGDRDGVLLGEGYRNGFAERTVGGCFLDIEWARDALARYRLSVEEDWGKVGTD